MERAVLDWQDQTTENLTNGTYVQLSMADWLRFGRGVGRPAVPSKTVGRKNTPFRGYSCCCCCCCSEFKVMVGASEAMHRAITFHLPDRHRRSEARIVWANDVQNRTKNMQHWVLQHFDGKNLHERTGDVIRTAGLRNFMMMYKNISYPSFVINQRDLFIIGKYWEKISQSVSQSVSQACTPCGEPFQGAGAKLYTNLACSLAAKI